VVGVVTGLLLRDAFSGDKPGSRFIADEAPSEPTGENQAGVGGGSRAGLWPDLEHTIMGEAYIPLGRASTVDALLPYTDGAAVVEVHALREQLRLFGDRTIATAEDVEAFEQAGKTIVEGQEIGPQGFLVSRLSASVTWLDGAKEDVELLVSGGIIDGRVHELAELPLLEPNRTYFLFLRRTPDGLVPEAIQFTLDNGVLQPLTFVNSGLSKSMSGKSVDEVRDGILTAYRNSPPKREAAPPVED
jgi:hypothetical protein